MGKASPLIVYNVTDCHHGRKTTLFTLWSFCSESTGCNRENQLRKNPASCDRWEKTTGDKAERVVRIRSQALHLILLNIIKCWCPCSCRILLLAIEMFTHQSAELKCDKEISDRLKNEIQTHQYKIRTYTYMRIS